MDADNTFLKTIRASFYLLFIIVPLIFTPWNFELFEFNKMLAVYFFTVVIAGSWIARMILQKKLIFKKSFFDIPLLLFLISQALATFFSIDRHTSFWGYYSRFNGGLLSTICYLVLFWSFIANMEEKSTLKTIKFILLTGVFISLYAIFEHYGHSLSCFFITGRFDVQCWIQDVKTRVFATLGQPNWLAAYLAILIPLNLGGGIISFLKDQGLPKRFFYFFLFTLYCLAFFYTKSQSGLLGLGVPLLVFWILLPLISRKEKSLSFQKIILLFFVFQVVLSLAFAKVGFNAYPQIDNFLKRIGFLNKSSFPVVPNAPETSAGQSSLEAGGSASGEIRKIVWKGAWEIFKHYPILGSGVETFAYSYYNFRPIEHNFVSEWDFLYNKAHNEYLNYLATTGLAGLGSYLIFIFCFLIWSLNQLRRKNDSHKQILILSLVCGWISILITNFFGFSVVIINLLFFMIPGFCVTLLNEEQTSKETNRGQLLLKGKASLAVIFLLSCWLLVSLVNLWRADVHYSNGEKARKSQQYDVAFQEIVKAISLNQKEPVYRNEVAESAANLALLYFQQKDATSAAKFMELALSQSQVALNISPKNLNFYKGRAKVLFSLAQIDTNYFPLLVETFKQAIQLAPTDPKLRYNLGIVYLANKDSDAALDSLQEAINLKSNYLDARYNLALYATQIGKKEIAQEQLEYILQNLDPKHDPSLKLLKQLK